MNCAVLDAFSVVFSLPLIPGVDEERDYNVTTIVDTSGSMHYNELRKAMSMLLSVKSQRPHLTLWMAYADTTLYPGEGPGGYDIRKIESLDDVMQKTKNVRGRGGTDFILPLEQVLECSKPDLILYYTDGYGSAPKDPPEVPIIWCIPASGYCKVPARYGRVVSIQ